MRVFLLPILALAATAPAQTICIDPGHPSEVGLGTRGVRQREVDVVFDLGRELGTRLRAAGYKVVMTKRDRTEKVLNRRRAEIANAARADLLVRLHCDAASGTGFSVYYPSQPGRSQGVKGPSRRVIDRSKRAATEFHAAMGASLAGLHRDRGLMTDLQTAVGARQGALTGSVFSQVPVLLVELAVLTNPIDEAFVSTPQGRNALVDALVAGTQAAVPLRSPRARQSW